MQNISLKICTGEKVALIGLNGSGKTTFVKLLCKIYQPTTGKILLNGTDINEISSSEYAKIISVVFQDYKIFSFTFKDNIILSGEDDIAKLDEATRDSGLEDKISLLPDRYETYINKDFSEDGIELSGGEGQKLALARVLYKNSPIVILDEPTAAVDAIAEQRMYEQISQLTKIKPPSLSRTECLQQNSVILFMCLMEERLTLLVDMISYYKNKEFMKICS